MTENDDRLNSVAETSRRLGVSKFTTMRLIKGNQIRGVRIGKRLLISESEIRRVMREGCGKHASNG
jgi:excisionase family DNA binding protein